MSWQPWVDGPNGCIIRLSENWEETRNHQYANAKLLNTLEDAAETLKDTGLEEEACRNPDKCGEWGNCMPCNVRFVLARLRGLH